MNSINSKFPLEGYLDSKQGGRAENQDFMGFSDTPHGFLLVLCDGMGGGPAGRLASTVVVDEVIKYVNSCPPQNDRQQILDHAIKKADCRIAELVRESPHLTGMGTTLVAVLINDYSAVVAHVGDSRLYQFRMGRKVFRTADHSRVGELVRMGKLTEEQARLSVFSNQITQAINGHGIAKPDFSELAFEKGDRFMLCSDGIWGMLPEPQLVAKVAKDKNLECVVYDLSQEIDEAGKASGNQHDNLSIAAFETTIKSKKKIPMSRKTLILIASLLVAFILSLVALFACYSYFAKENRHLTDRNKELSESVAALKYDIKQVEDSLNKSNQKLSAAQIETIKAQVETVKAEAKAATATAEAATAKANAASAEARAKAAVAKSNSSSKTSAKSGSTSRYQNQINTLKKWIGDIDRRHKITESSIKQLIDQLKDKSECNSVVKELERARSVAKKQDQSLDKMNAKLKEHFNKAKQQLEKIK